jgi:ubiquinone/menaquinone biosynthesis C-methylase UbiE
MHPVFFEIHDNMPRQGPGSFASTKRALDMIHVPSNAALLDVGCGPGQQTFDLARLTHAKITAVDYYQMYVDEVVEKIARNTLSHQISVQQGDMNDLPFSPESFDIIWSEGAIYIMGFENGLKQWRSLLKSNGYIAVSEPTWLRDDAPENLVNFWQAEYDIKNMDDNLSIIKKCGYKVVGSFALPASDWWENYYSIIESRLPQFREKYKNDPEALQIIQMEADEIQMHKEYSDYYGYVFYVMQK